MNLCKIDPLVRSEIGEDHAERKVSPKITDADLRVSSTPPFELVRVFPRRSVVGKDNLLRRLIVKSPLRMKVSSETYQLKDEDLRVSDIDEADLADAFIAELNRQKLIEDFSESTAILSELCTTRKELVRNLSGLKKDRDTPFVLWTNEQKERHALQCRKLNESLGEHFNSIVVPVIVGDSLPKRVFPDSTFLSFEINNRLPAWRAHEWFRKKLNRWPCRQR